MIENDVEWGKQESQRGEREIGREREYRSKNRKGGRERKGKKEGDRAKVSYRKRE